VLAGPQLVLELLPGPDSVWTGRGLHPRVLAWTARRLDRLLPHVSHLLLGRCYCSNSTDNPSSGPSCSARNWTCSCARSEHRSGGWYTTRSAMCRTHCWSCHRASPAIRRQALNWRSGEPSSPFRDCPTG